MMPPSAYSTSIEMPKGDPRSCTSAVRWLGTAAAAWATAEFAPGQEIVIIGVRLDRALVQDQFESALLTDAEVAAGQQEWLTYHDPLPAWGVTHTH